MDEIEHKKRALRDKEGMQAMLNWEFYQETENWGRTQKQAIVCK